MRHEEKETFLILQIYKLNSSEFSRNITIEIKQLFVQIWIVRNAVAYKN